MELATTKKTDIIACARLVGSESIALKVRHSNRNNAWNIRLLLDSQGSRQWCKRSPCCKSGVILINISSSAKANFRRTLQMVTQHWDINNLIERIIPDLNPCVLLQKSNVLSQRRAKIPHCWHCSRSIIIWMRFNSNVMILNPWYTAEAWNWLVWKQECGPTIHQIVVSKYHENMKIILN